MTSQAMQTHRLNLLVPFFEKAVGDVATGHGCAQLVEILRDVN